LRDFTHGGGVVVKQHGQDCLFLLVKAKATEIQWVFPKGHLEPGEDTAAAALREVREEAGVEAKLLGVLGPIEFIYNNQQVRAQFFLLQYLRDVIPEENRQKRWCKYEEALDLLYFPEHRQLLRMARLKLAEMLPYPAAL
jgi:8-oxo-dGTP pyrophosphatase MutT (NUDIX family)